MEKYFFIVALAAVILIFIESIFSLIKKIKLKNAEQINAAQKKGSEAESVSGFYFFLSTVLLVLFWEKLQHSLFWRVIAWEGILIAVVAFINYILARYIMYRGDK